MYYFDKAGYELMEQDDSIIGVGLEFYCKALNVAVILSRPFHETIHGHRIENAKNDLCRKNNIRLIRILAAGCHGVPVSYRGAGSSAVILRVVPCRNFPSVRMVQSGSRVKDSLRMEVMFRQRGTLFSLTGKMTEALTM